ncbi:MAG TPA: hypothetical protein VMS77_04120 [Conexivisphaerales archaeon]|nr:hypothetical protein [Conexivisphaerales archaeon]
MGRTTILFGFWILGYAIGFIGYLLIEKTNLLQGFLNALYALFGDKELANAAIVGLATSLLSLAILIAWSYTQKS